MEKHLKIGEWDPVSKSIEIEGTRYSAGLFKELGCSFPYMVGQILRVDRKENGVVTVTRMTKFEDADRAFEAGFEKAHELFCRCGGSHYTHKEIFNRELKAFRKGVKE